MDNALEVLRKKLRQLMNDKADVVSNGVPSWDNYNQLVGEIRGLALAERELLDLAEKIKAQDE